MTGPELHADALAVLGDWTPPTERQAALRARYLDHLADHPAGLSRLCLPDHITASTLIVSADLDRVLLTLHAKAGAWFQMGGHCEPGDRTLAGAALREAVEESGITALEIDPVPVQLSAHDVPFCDPRGTAQHLDVRFAARAPHDATPVASSESDEVAWWPVDDLPNDAADIAELVELSRRRLSAASGTR